MKRILVYLAMVTLLGAISLAQTVSPAAASQNSSASQSSSTSATTSDAQASSKNSNAASTEAGGSSFRLAEGSTIHALLNKPVDAKKNKPGDEVVAKTAEDLKFNGQVAIPKGSKVMGHITQAQTRSKDHSESAVGISFDRLVLKDGREIPLSASIQTIAQSETAAAASADDEPAMMGSSGGGMSGGGRSGASAGGAAGTSGGRAVGSATGAVANTAGGAANTAERTIGQTASVYSSGQLSASSQGVIGLKGISLNSEAGAAQGSVISSDHQNVHLDSGTQLILRVNAK